MHQGEHLSIIPLEIYNTLHNAAASYCSINAMFEPHFFCFFTNTEHNSDFQLYWLCELRGITVTDQSLTFLIRKDWEMCSNPIVLSWRMVYN